MKEEVIVASNISIIVDEFQTSIIGKEEDVKTAVGIISGFSKGELEVHYETGDKGVTEAIIYLA